MSLHEAYRPTEWEHVVGQDGVVAALRGVIERGESQCFLFCGPSGVGKTTLAKLAARKLGCDGNVIETNGAANTGIDDMRRILETLSYRPFGDSTARGIIIDECQRLSKQAFDSLLKDTENPPSHVFWFFTTTEPDKVPAALKTRSTMFTLRPVADDELAKLYFEISTAEEIVLSPDISKLIIHEARGSPRQLLVNMATCRTVTSKAEAAKLLQSAEGSPQTIELCRYIAHGLNYASAWDKAMQIVGKFENERPESIRIVLQHYMASAALKAKSDREACYFLNIMEQFAAPFNDSEGMAPLIRALGRVKYAGN